MDPTYDEKRDLERESADLKKTPSHHVTVTAAGVDDALRLTLKQGSSQPLSPEAALKLRKKIDKHILPLMMIRKFTCITPCSPPHFFRSVLGPVYGQDDPGEQRYPWHPN